MKLQVLLLLGLAAFANSGLSLTDAAKEAATQLETAMKEEAKAAAPKEDEERYSRENVRAAMLGRIRSLLARGQPNQVEEALTQVGAYFQSDAVLSATKNFQNEIQREREAQDKAVLEEIQGAITRAGEAVRQAKKPADLDAILASLGRLRQNREGRVSEEVRAAAYQIDPTLQFVTRWQDYLAAEATGNAQGVQDALRDLSQNSRPALVPRSEILARMKSRSAGKEPADPRTAQQAAEEIVARTKSLEGMENALKELRQLLADTRTQQSGGQDSINAYIQALQPLEKAYREFQAGLAANIDIATQSYGGNEAAQAAGTRLKSELLLLMLPRYVGASPETKSKPGENVLQFVDRLIQEAKDRGDAAVAIRAREARRLLVRGSSISNNDLTALNALVSGQNQETAGQYLMAVISYQNALKSGSDLVPAKVIGERLQAIQSAHPKEFEQAMERVLNPPAPAYPERVPGRVPGESGRPQQPALLIPPAPVPAGSPPPKESPTQPKTTDSSSPKP